jgi:beta-phosphoglucomutase-like phosphatase (HAD superfamily)
MTRMPTDVDAIVSSDDVEHAKPAPDLYMTACARPAAEPERSVALEDSRTGTASALAARMFVITRCGTRCARDLRLAYRHRAQVLGGHLRTQPGNLVRKRTRLGNLVVPWPVLGW